MTHKNMSNSKEVGFRCYQPCELFRNETGYISINLTPSLKHINRND